jgi:hypothetical protein
MTLYNELYCDYDGVLVDFRGGVLETCGKGYMDPYYNTKEGEKERGDILAKAGPEFWANLKPLPDYEQLWTYLKPLDPYILTAHASWCEVNAQNSRDGKILWNAKYTQVHPYKLLVVKRDDKQNWAKNQKGVPNILVDDYKKNIKQWESAGGIGVYHKSAAQTIAELQEILADDDYRTDNS